MSRPLNELKRRLEDDSTPLPKRLRLAKNVVNSHHFPTTPKERVIGEWLEGLTASSKITSKELKDVLSWLNNVDDFTVGLKYKLIKIVSQYLRNNILQNEDVQYITDFIENSKISIQLSLQVTEYLSITTTLLQHLASEPNTLLINRILDNITKYYKDCKKKLEFIFKFIEEENLETIFMFLKTEKAKVITVCQTVLFPINIRAYYARYLNNLVRKDDLSTLLQDKNDHIESVIKIMDAFIKSKANQQFLSDFISVFVSCFKSESQLLFAFYIIAVNCLDMKQSYIKTVTRFTPITFDANDAKIKRSIFFNMLQYLLENEVDISVHLRDTLNISSKETKKTFLVFLKDVMLGTLKLEGKPDKTTLNIIKTALKLDPTLIEQKVDEILPSIMVSKKSSNVIDTYSETVNILVHTLFKLGKGINFIHDLLPSLKKQLENLDDNQNDLRQSFNESILSNGDSEKLKSKIITGFDILPKECVENYGRLLSELMFRQNKEILMLLQKDLEKCLDSIEDNVASPSSTILIEMLSAILSSFLRHNKMADHTVPLPIGEDFWTVYGNFENQCLKKYGECLLTVKKETPLLTSFLDICISFTELKILNIKYSNTKLEFPVHEDSDISDLSIVLPCLNGEKWKEIASKVNDDAEVILFNNLLLLKTMAIQLLTNENEESIMNTKTHLIKQFSNTPILNTFYSKTLFANLDKKQQKQLAKSLLKIYENNLDVNIFQNEFVASNKNLVKSILFEVLKCITKKLEITTTLSKSLGKDEFEIATFLKNSNVTDFFNVTENVDFEQIQKYLDVLKHLQIYYLDENCQLTSIFVLLVLKKCCSSKKIKRVIDYTLQSIFEVSSKIPDVFKIFSVPFIFDFENGIIKLLQLNSKTSNHVMIIKDILTLATRKVKAEPEIIKTLVQLLLDTYKKNKIYDIEHFTLEVFQIICILLPVIAKEKKNIPTSIHKGILTKLQEEIHKSLLQSFKSVNFGKNVKTSDSGENVNNNMATLNAMEAYALTLGTCCESNDGVDCLWSGLDFFVRNAIQTIENSEIKSIYIHSSLHLLTIILRYIRKLETHDIFKNKDKLCVQIWKALKSRLFTSFDHRLKKSDSCLEEMSVTLKLLTEVSSVECFVHTFVGDLTVLSTFKKPSLVLKNEEITASQIINRKVLKYICLTILSAYTVEPKFVAFTKLIFKSTKNLRFWIQQHYLNREIQDGGNMDIVKIDEPICELLRMDLDVLAEVVLTAKKISLDYKFLDAIFESQQLIHYILGRSIDNRCETTWRSFFMLFEGCVAILNNMILSRDELLEDRWPCFMQSYKTLVLCMCHRSTTHTDIDRNVELKLAEIAHSIEKLTQSICKRKTHVSRIAAYAVADFCSWLEKSPPPKIIRQHLENSIVLLIQASDSNYAMAFLRRGLAGSIGQMTLTNMYTMYKRYHKYVGNA